MLHETQVVEIHIKMINTKQLLFIAKNCKLYSNTQTIIGQNQSIKNEIQILKTKRNLIYCIIYEFSYALHRWESYRRDILSSNSPLKAVALNSFNGKNLNQFHILDICH